MQRQKFSIIAFCLLVLCVSGGRVALCTAAQNPPPETTIQLNTTDPLQALFTVGLYELERGNYVAAIQVFESLAQQTDSPRVRLELARALFLDRQFSRSKVLFTEVQTSPATPHAVKENIQFYLDEIDDVLGSVKFALSVVTDSNPRNFTDSRQVQIAGETLTVIPPEDNEEVTGIKYSLNGAKALTGTASLQGYGSISFSDYPNRTFDRWFGDAGLLLSPRQLRFLRFRIGVEEAYRDGEHLYEFPYAGLMLYPKPSRRFNVNTEFKIGALHVPDADYLDATNLTLTTKISNRIGRKLLLNNDLYLETSSADEDAYSYSGGSLGASLSFPVLKVLTLKPYLSAGQRNYEDRDPFFGVERKDKRYTAGLTVTIRNLRIFNLTPEFGVTYEETDSNIEFYSYDKTGFIFNLR